MAPRQEAQQQDDDYDPTTPTSGLARQRGWHVAFWRNRSLRARLFLLVIASVVPLVCMGIVREYLNFLSDRAVMYDGLLGTARGLAVAVERDLQLRVSSLETLATSPALRIDDLSQFDQAEAFLARQPNGSFLGLATRDLQIQRLYGPSGVPVEQSPRRCAGNAGVQYR